MDRPAALQVAMTRRLRQGPGWAGSSVRLLARSTGPDLMVVAVVLRLVEFPSVSVVKK